MSDLFPEPVWREFSLFNESAAAPERRLRLDVRHVVAVIEDTRRDSHCFQPIAVIRLHDGHEYVVTDYSRNVSSDCALPTEGK
jgi:hypothetical protein